MNQPTDQAQRELAVDVHRSVIVQAPAGSGKTTLLVTRYLRLLARAQKPEELLAITFTIKSAAEMQARILSALRNVEPEAEAALARNDKMGWNLLQQPGRLKIQTIDSFAMSVIRQLPLASGLYPYTQLIEQAQHLYSNATRRVLYKLYEDDPLAPCIADFLGLLENDYSQAQRLLTHMLSRRDQWLDAVRELVRAHQESPRALQSVLSRGIERLVDRAVSELTEALGNTQVQVIESTVRGVASTREQNVDQTADFWRLAGETLTTKKGEFRRQLTRREGFGPEDGEAKEQARVLIEDLRALNCEPLVDNLRYLPETQIPDERLDELATICIVLTLSVVELNEEFQRESTCDFNQLLLSARNALRVVGEPTELALALDYRIHHILVDEFQDTSVSQFELFTDLLDGWSKEDGNTFFAVGDPMQSIYRFRDADVSLFYRAWHDGIAGIALSRVRLSSNFRARPELIDWHNETFAAVMGTIEDPLLGRVPYERAVAERPHSVDGGVRLDLYDDQPHQIAGVVTRIIELTAADPQAHIAVLVRSRSHLALLLPALREAEISWRARDIDPLIDKPVVMDLISLLCAIDNAEDRLAWMSVLRAPWVGLSLPDLEQFTDIENVRTAIIDGRASLSEDGEVRITRLKLALLAGIPLIDQEPPRSVIEAIWLRCGGVDAYSDPHTIEHAECLLELIDAQGASGLDPEAVRMAAQNLFAGDTTEVPLEIMTIHKSKGLEFDHVVLPHLERITARSAAPLLRWRPESPGILIGARGTPGSYAWLAREDDAREAHELERLLYVACTRAKESLHVFASVEDNPSPTSLLSLLWPQLRSERIHKADSQPQQGEFFQASNYERLPHGYQWTPPVELDPLATVSPHSSITPSSNLEGKLDVSLGTVLHRVFFALAEHGYPADLDVFINERRDYWCHELRELKVPDIEHPGLLEEISRQIRNVVNDERGRWLLKKYPGAASELPLSGTLAGEMINVFLDRTFVDQDIQWVIDYKTANRGPDQSVESFIRMEVQRYVPQMERYRKLASEVFDSPVRVALYFTALPHFEVLT